MTDRPSFELAIDTRFLYERLIKVGAGGIVSYNDLSEIIGRRVDGGNPNLQSAIRRAFRLDGFVFSNIKSTGYQRLTDAEIVRNATKDTDAIRRRSRRAGERLTKVEDFSQLKPQDRVEHNVRLSIFAAIGQMTRSNAVKILEVRVVASGRELPFAETLDAFRRP